MQNRDEFEQYRAQPVDEFEQFRAPSTIAKPNALSNIQNSPFNPTKENINEAISAMVGSRSVTSPLKALWYLVRKIGNPLPISEATKNISPLEQKASTTNEELQSATQAENEAKAQAQVQGLPPNINIAQGKIFQNQNRLNQLEESMGEQPPVLPRHIEEAQTNVTNAESAHNEANTIANEVEDTIGAHLNKGAAHDVRAAARIRNAQEAKHNEISNGYSDLENDLQSKNIEVDNSEKIAKKTNDLLQFFIKGKERSPEATQVSNEIKELEESQSMNASDYLRAYRSVKQYAREARSKAYKPGMNAEERHEWMEKYNDLDAKVEEMGKTLEEGIGAEHSETLQNLNSRWRKEVVPMYRNTIYQNILKNGRMPDNIIKSLRGTNPGNILMKEMIKKDPELLRNVVGQRYKKPEEIFNPDENMQEYTQQMPELQHLSKQREQAQNAVQSTKEAFNQAKENHKQISENAESYASKRIQIEKLQSNLAIAERNVENLRRVASRKNLNLNQKMKAEKELSNAVKIRNKARLKIGTVIVVPSTLIGAKKLYSFGKALLSNTEQGQAEPQGAT